MDNQGPTPGIAGGSWLTLDTALQPFKKLDGTYYVSHDVVDIENQLGYSYDNVSSSTSAGLLTSIAPAPVVAHVSGVNKGDMRGSFMLGVFGTVGGKEQLLGQESILSRWHVEGCGNCQLHTGVRRYIPLYGVTHDHVDSGELNEKIKVFTRDDGVKDGVTLTPKVSIIKRFVK